MKLIIHFLLITFSVSTLAQSNNWKPESWEATELERKLFNIPYWVVEKANSQELSKTHSIAHRKNPFLLTGDFNADDKVDVAVWVLEESTGKLGLSIFLFGGQRHYLLGGGRKFGNGGDDFSWVDMYHVSSKSSVPTSGWEDKEPNPKGDVIDIAKFASASAAIYWDGDSFVWYQVGD